MSTDVIIEKSTNTVNKIRKPKQYKVVILNDDVTPMEFVIVLLMSIFRHDRVAAIQLTMEIHNNGSAVAGIYTQEIADQKQRDAASMAASNGFPLRIRIQPE